MAIVWSAKYAKVAIGLEITYALRADRSSMDVKANVYIDVTTFQYTQLVVQNWAVQGFVNQNFNNPWYADSQPQSATDGWEKVSEGIYRLENPPSAVVNLSFAGPTTVSATAYYVVGSPVESASQSVDLPTRLVYTPDAPGTPTVKRKTAADGTSVITWTRAASYADPTIAYATQEVQTQINDTAAVATTIGSVSASQTSIEHTTAINNRYRYRVRAVNAGGASDWSAWSDWIATTPAAPVVGTPTRTGTVINATWANTAPYRTSTKLGWVTNGGAETDPGVVAAPADTAAAVTIALGSTNQYRVYHVIDGVPLVAGGTATLVSAPSSWSAVIAAQDAPAAPTVSLSATVIDAAATALTVSFVHNPVDASAQTAAEVAYRKGTDDWTTVTLTTQTSKVFAAGTLANENSYEIKVRTAGAYGGYGPYSTPLVVTTSGTPSVTIVAPDAGSTIASATLSLDLGWYDPASQSPSRWSVQITDVAGTVLWSADALPGTTNAATYYPPYVLANGGTYKVRVRAMDSVGLWSQWATAQFGVAYAQPANATSTGASWDPATGRVSITVLGYAPEGSEIQVVSRRIEWFNGQTWITAVAAVPLSTDEVVVEHVLPPTHTTVTYRIVSVSSIPSVAYSPSFEVATPADGWIYVNGGDGFATQARVHGNQSLKHQPSRAKELITPVGRSKPIELYGDAETDTWSIGGYVATRQMREAVLGTMAEWEAVSKLPAPVCLRDYTGARVFCSIDDVNIDKVSGAVSARLTEVDYVEQ